MFHDSGLHAPPQQKKKDYTIHVNDPIDQENDDCRRKATSLQVCTSNRQI